MIERQAGGERGTTILEVVVASAILVTLMAGLMSLAALAISTTENQGHLAARTTEYAQDKMEQLLALAYGDSSSNTVIFPTAISGGTGLALGGAVNADGSLNLAAPADKYVDWIAADGSLLGGGTTRPAGWFYERVWAVTSSSTDERTVTVTVRSSVGGFMLAKSTVVALKASQF